MFSALSLESRSCILQAVEIPSETNRHFDWLTTKDLLLREQMMIYYPKEMEQVVPVEMRLMTKQWRWDLHSCKRIRIALSGIICIGVEAEENEVFIWLFLVLGLFKGNQTYCFSPRRHICIQILGKQYSQIEMLEKKHGKNGQYLITLNSRN